MHLLAAFHNSIHLITTTESSFGSILFKSPPFHSFTIFILEVSPNPFKNIHSPYFVPIERRILLHHPIIDPDAETFNCSNVNEDDKNVVVAGFAQFVPSYQLFQPVFRMEQLFVRDCYRGKGFGKMMLSALAEQAVKMGFTGVEWFVLDWNVNAKKFYEKMGSEELSDWKFWRLTGDALHFQS